MCNKQVIATVSICPNYLFHLLATARVVFDSEYADIYAAFLSRHDKLLLEQYKQDLSFGGGSAGELVDAIIALPIVAGLSSREAFEEYFAALSQVAATRDMVPILDRYPVSEEQMYPWPGVGQEDVRIIVDQHIKIAALAEVVIRNFEMYTRQVWPKQQPRLEKIAVKLNHYFHQRDFVAAWEDITSLTYHRLAFFPELCSAIKNGPNANSCAYDRVIFYHETPWENLTQLISHEIGTHLLYPIFKELQTSGAYQPNVLYHAMEALAMWYNRYVTGTGTLTYDLASWSGPDYLNCYTDLRNTDPSLGARELLVRGVELVGK